MDGMQHIGKTLEAIGQNMRLNSSDPIARYGFTPIPNFIIKDANVSPGAKVVYALLLSYAWNNNLCFPGQQRLADDMGMTRVRITQLMKELQDVGLVEIERRGLNKTNIYTLNYVVKAKRKKGVH